MEWDELFNGKVVGVCALAFWAEVQKANATSDVKLKELQSLAPVAAMLLAQPAGESVDDVAFSSSGGTLTKERCNLNPSQVEMITVVRMYIRTFGWEPKEIDD